MCGELFCSRKCLRSAYNDHKAACMEVCSHAEVGLFITQAEMSESLSEEEKAQACGETLAREEEMSKI